MFKKEINKMATKTSDSTSYAEYDRPLAHPLPFDPRLDGKSEILKKYEEDKTTHQRVLIDCLRLFYLQFKNNLKH